MLKAGKWLKELGKSLKVIIVVYDRAHSAIAEAESGDFDWEEIFARWLNLFLSYR
jgi:2-dehydro-3-deoxygluconokinase